jgi:Hint domain
VSSSLLINGTTITLYDADELDELEFFHIKLARHDVIYAEGAPWEALMNIDENAVNFAGYLRRHGDLVTSEISVRAAAENRPPPERNTVASAQRHLALD